RASGQRPHPHRRHADLRPDTEQGRSRLPGSRALPVADGPRQRGLRARAHGRRRRPTPGDRPEPPGADGPEGLRGEVSPRALRRHAAAGSHRTRPRPRHTDPPHGRALRRPRRADAPPHGRVAGRGASPYAADGRLRHPQPARGHRALGPHRGDDGAAGPDQGRDRRAAALSARPRRPRRGGAPCQALGTDPRGIAARHGRPAVRIWLWRLGLPLTPPPLWEPVARMLTPLLSVGPSQLPGALARVLATRDLPPLPGHAWLTVSEIAAAYVLAVAGGLWVGFLLGLRQIVGRIYEPLPATPYALPSVGWDPSLMLFFGLGPPSQIAFGFLLGFFPLTPAGLAGIRQVRATLVTVAMSMGARPWTIFRKVMLPAMASTMVGGLRTGLALSVVGVLVGELLGARAGLGYV